jgi:hypothetical protein
VLYNSQGITQSITVKIWDAPAWVYVNEWKYHLIGPSGSQAVVTIGKNGSALLHTHTATSADSDWVACRHPEGELELNPEDTLEVYVSSPSGAPTQVGIQCDIVELRA